MMPAPRNMTFAEALMRATAATKAHWAAMDRAGWEMGLQQIQHIGDELVRLEALGLIEFEPEKTEDQQMHDALQAAWLSSGCGHNASTGPVKILEVLTERGFTVARKP